MDTTKSSSERRRAARLKAGCDAELTATLAILDSDAQLPTQSLVFFGRTRDLSAGGLALVLPSTTIDEKYCGKAASLQLTLHLPTRTVNLELNPVRFVPLSAVNTAIGYLIGARIVSVDEDRYEYDRYLRTIAKLRMDG